MKELNPSEFSNTQMAPWAQAREEMFGDMVKPVQLFAVDTEDGPHHVAWSQYSLLDFNDGEFREGYHIMCDCAAVTGTQDPIGAWSRCAHLGAAFLARGEVIRKDINSRNSDNLISEDLAIAITEELDDLIAKRALHVLEDDLEHPERWHANTFSGRHNIPMLSRILRISEKTIAQSLAPIAELGVVSLRGTVVKLNLAA